MGNLAVYSMFNTYQGHGENKPQINADERRLIVNFNIQHFSEVYPVNCLIKSLQSTQSTAAPMCETALRQRLRTRIIRIGRNYTDTFNPCTSVSSALSVFYCNSFAFIILKPWILRNKRDKTVQEPITLLELKKGKTNDLFVHR